MQADLMKACATCHDVAGLADTPFLAGPDRYQSFVSWPRIVAAVPEQSILLTHAVTGKGHIGTNLDSAALKPTLFPKVKAWLAEEAKTFVAPPQMIPHIEPFAPIIGFNAVYLEPLGMEFSGMAVTFSADFLTPTTLELSDIQVHPTSKAGVHMVHPLFVMYPVGVDPIPDPVDSFSNLDQTFDIGKSGTLGPGTVLLVNWQKDARLSLAFETIEAIVAPDPDAGDGGSGPGGGCKDVAGFDANARPALQQRCAGCHGGNNGQATSALDMSALNADSTKACAQVLNRVSPADPPSSQIFITTDPNGNAAHPYKFGGNAGTFSTFRDDLSIWIAAEK
jgi:cytochrome c553